MNDKYTIGMQNLFQHILVTAHIALSMAGNVLMKMLMKNSIVAILNNHFDINDIWRQRLKKNLIHLKHLSLCGYGLMYGKSYLIFKQMYDIIKSIFNVQQLNHSHMGHSQQTQRCYTAQVSVQTSTCAWCSICCDFKKPEVVWPY